MAAGELYVLEEAIVQFLRIDAKFFHDCRFRKQMARRRYRINEAERFALQVS
ncbi:hypothetical protein D3C84_1038030 [compost metagenome]